MKKILVFMLTFALAATASAQRLRVGEQSSGMVRVTGRVIDLQNKPVSDVIVKLVSGSKTLAFTSTNAKGEYSLELKSAPSGERLRVGEQSSGMVTLQFTHISYEKESLPLPPPNRVEREGNASRLLLPVREPPTAGS